MTSQAEMSKLDRRLFVGAALSLALPGTARAQAIATARVGDAALQILSDGSISTPITQLVRDVQPDVLRAALAEAGPVVAANQNALNVPVLALGREVVMFDCGAGRNFLPSTGRLPQAAEGAGLDPAAVTQVLFTHAHPDHLWGALDDFDTPAYPNATYHIAEAEWAFWTAADVFARLPEERHAFAAGAQRVLKALEPQLNRFRPGAEIVPGITAIDTAGHSPGHVSYAVAAASDNLMILGDVFTHRHLSFRHPEWATAFDQDPERASATRRQLADRLAQERTLVATYHLPGGGLGRVERAGTAYRFVPAA
ncbi:MBL fold metallo-hydrolase [Phreatobacter sp. AB_2022a]|uniref:MBL fold metallo-hydrolase n=1 Tax=Phreatobacter sp. AB_2022a TaxID=3003134 RepID=UPI0022871EB3|nr:MBL fold metallo-hydrolase [Phreatobacter sp. AB_2022a]MCZ0734928.1 MBL fold metallo-hydrolase [Phreatobacter sp. AB_2022a]